MRRLRKLFLLSGNSIVSTKTEISSIESGPFDDAASVGCKTTIGSAEIYTPPVHSLDSSTISSITTILGIFTELYHITTFDYNWNPYYSSYNFDGSIPVSGSVGANNDDQGFIAE